MARKKKHPEHENLERWLVSYADFITLLFATFVVLYALAQTDVNDFIKLEESLRHAFSQNAMLQGQESILDGSDSLFDTVQGNSFIPSLMLEYISPKYEQSSFNEIENAINELKATGQLQGISSELTDKGLLITFEEKYLFSPGSAVLSSKAQKILDKVGVIICKKFILHSMRVEGHTDSTPIHSAVYPSNWELSGARASSVVRYLIERFKFSPSLFSAVGYADTRPLKNSISPKDPINRRVEILILKNKYKQQFENKNDFTLKLTKEEQEKIQKQRTQIIKLIEGNTISPAAQKLLEENNERLARQRSYRLEKKSKELYKNLEHNLSENENFDTKVIKLDSSLPIDEDFGL